MKKLPTYKPTEHQIMDACIGLLRAKGYKVFRMNSGKYSVGEGKNRRFIMGHEAGTPDIMAFKEASDTYGGGFIHEHTHLLFIEVKVPGNKPTSLQTAKMAELQEYGAKCIWVTSSEELEEKIKEL